MKVLGIIILLTTAMPAMSEGYLEMSKKLAVLRSDVDSLAHEVEDLRKKQSTELRSYSLQRAELESSVRKEEIRKKHLVEKIKRIKNDLEKNDQGHQDLKPFVVEYAQKLSEYVEQSIPFKNSERISNLLEIESDLNKGDINSYQALSRLWSAFEDEQRLSRETQLAKEKIDIHGKTYFAEVLKLGSLTMYFRLEDGKYGKTIRDQDKWSFSFLEKENEVVAARKLFDGVKKQIKVGEYIIPGGI